MRRLIGLIVGAATITGCSNVGFTPDEVQHQVSISQSKPKMNILFVIDSSGSMNSALSKLGSRFQELVTNLPDVEWKMAVVKASGDGEFLPFLQGQDGDCSGATSTGEYFLDWQTDTAVMSNRFSLTVQCAGSGGGDGQAGIQAAYGAISKYETSQLHQQFFSAESHLAFVVISDEDDVPRDTNDIGAIDFRHAVNDWPNHPISWAWHSIVTMNDSCTSGNSRVIGTNYMTLTGLTRGVVGDICADSFADTMTQIGKDIRTTTREVDLGCAPINNQVVVNFGKGIEPVGYSLNGQVVTFDDYLEPGAYDLVFECTAQIF